MKKFCGALLALGLIFGMAFTGCAADSDDSGSHPDSGNKVNVTVDSITLNVLTLNLAVGEKYTIKSTLKGINAADSGVNWESSRPDVVSVKESGEVECLAAGTARITATAKADSTKSVYCDVTVEEAQVFESTKKSYDVSSDAAHSFSYTGSGATVYVYSVTGGLNFYGIKVGDSLWNVSSLTAGTISAGSALTSGGVTVDAVVSGADTMTIDAKNVTIDGNSFSKRFKTGGGGSTVSRALKLTLTGSTEVVFYVASSSGSATREMIVETIENGAAAVTTVRPTAIALDKYSETLKITEEETAPTVTFTPVFTPSDVTPGYDSLYWSSENTDVATVENGVVTGKSKGSAKITATTVNGLSVSCVVTVEVVVAAPKMTASDQPVGFATIDLSKITNGSVTVNNKADFVDYATRGGYIIYVDGIIDLAEGMLPETAGGTTPALDAFVARVSEGEYTSYKTFIDEYTGGCTAATHDKDKVNKATWGACTTMAEKLWTLHEAHDQIIKIRPVSNTIIMGLDGAELSGGSIYIADVSNVVVRNLTIRDGYDPFPHHEAYDGFNSQYDTVSISGGCSNIWIDHCTLKDTMKIGKAANGEKFQTYDGLCDIKDTGKNIVVSYNRLQDHDKTMLIGSNATNGSNKIRTVTLHHNYYLNCGQRLPMVRNTQLHNFNNCYEAVSGGISNSYCIGNRENALIVSENNYFGSGIKASYTSNGGKVYRSGDTGPAKDKISGISFETEKPFTVPYEYTLEPAATSYSSAIINSGAGLWQVKQ